jgi:tetratricopeptide (TPR) repeat protein
LIRIVPHSNSASVITIDLRAPARRALVILPALLAILSAWFIVRWYVGDTVAEYAPENPASAAELARLATRWAPGDPFAHWTLGALEEKEFSANNLADAVHEYEIAVTLSPNDYRYWMELGRGLEAAGDNAGGERALGRAVDLAPAYSLPRWYFGNLLLRQGKLDEAFQQFARASDADPQLRGQVFNLAWQVFGGNVDEIAKVACPSATARTLFAIYLVGLNRPDDALRIWATNSPADRMGQTALGADLEKALIEAKHFHAALEVGRYIEAERGAPPALETFRNGGFESEIKLPSNRNFDWVIKSVPQAQIGIDTGAHNGHGSLRLILAAPNKLDAINVAQLIAVEPNTQYRVEYFARTEALNSGSTPLVMIIDTADGTALAASPPLPTGTNDWQRIAFDFKTKPKSDGVIVKLTRQPCDDGSICPIFGTVWYDDFNLQRSSGPAGSRGATASGKR